MRVRRISTWLGPVGGRAYGPGEVCDMPDDLAAAHIADGGAVEVPADTSLDSSPPAAHAADESEEFDPMSADLDEEAAAQPGLADPSVVSSDASAEPAAPPARRKRR